MLIVLDNLVAIAMRKNPVHHKKSKHIDIRYHFVRKVVKKNIEVKYCGSELMIADILT